MLVLREQIAREQRNMNVLKLSIINMVKLKDMFPNFKSESLAILKELIEKQ